MASNRTGDAADFLTQALALHEAGKFAEAEPMFEEILSREPDNPRVLYRLGVLALQTGRPERAAEFLQRSIVIQPKLPAAHTNLGVALRSLGRPAEAVDAYDRAIALAPNNVDAHNNRANALVDLERFAEALASSERAIALQPDNPGLYNNHGNALMGLGRHAEALESFDRTVAGAPGNAGGHYNRGNALSQLKRPQPAIEAYDRAVALNPNHARAHSNRGTQLLELKRFAEALASFDIALRLNPDLPEPYNNRGDALLQSGRVDEAISSFDQALIRRPGYPDARWNRSLGLLSLGRFEEGWDHYEDRWQVESFVTGSSAQVTPELRARLSHSATLDDLAGRRVLMVAEQGVGDVLMFASILPDLMRIAGPVALMCEPRLHRLFASSLPPIGLLAPDASDVDLASFDCVLAVGSLGRLFRNRLEDFPGTPYLTASPPARDAWVARLGSKSARRRLGLSWRGGTPKTGRDNRSLTLDQLRPLLERQDCEFVNLQYGDPSSEIAAANASLQRPIRMFPPAEIEDFDDLAGLVQSLDGVVSVQTALVHLAGALGVPALVMVPHVAEWRYTAAAASMPWYGSVSLFRQGADRDWAPVIGRVAERLDVLD
jgi:tetratricopeptide (TPR) repeat protein